MDYSPSPRVKVESYYPDIVKELILRIESSTFRNICLCGFGETMKWLSRLLEEEYVVTLSDTRTEFFNYDCGNKIVQPIFELDLTNSVIIMFSVVISRFCFNWRFL